jgi:hypothetical protein
MHGALAEADGNRTRQRYSAALTSFEDRSRPARIPGPDLRKPVVSTGQGPLSLASISRAFRRVSGQFPADVSSSPVPLPCLSCARRVADMNGPEDAWALLPRSLPCSAMAHLPSLPACAPSVRVGLLVQRAAGRAAPGYGPDLRCRAHGTVSADNGRCAPIGVKLGGGPHQVRHVRQAVHQPVRPYLHHTRPTSRRRVRKTRLAPKLQVRCSSGMAELRDRRPIEAALNCARALRPPRLFGSTEQSRACVNLAPFAHLSNPVRVFVMTKGAWGETER